MKPHALDFLKKAHDNPQATFHPGQWEAISALVDQRQRLLVIQKTGWGKSLVYFVAAQLFHEQRPGISLVVSPLLALMRNQVSAANRLGIPTAVINSANREQWPDIIAAALDNRLAALLVSPERLANEPFRKHVLDPLKDRLNLLVVDEAHCVTAHGHDFRPDYRRLARLVTRLSPDTPVLATTATADLPTINDLKTQLGLTHMQKGPLTRESLCLSTHPRPSTPQIRRQWLADNLNHLPGSGIIYTLTVKSAEEVAACLREDGHDVQPYHAQLANPRRLALEDALQEDRLKALVATSALGMGYDKPDLGFVVHYQAPASLAAYYQQVGRAGRAIDTAHGVLMNGIEDDDLHSFFRDHAFPTYRSARNAVDVLQDNGPMGRDPLAAKTGLKPHEAAQMMRFLAALDTPPVAYDYDTHLWTPTGQPLELDVQHIAAITHQRTLQWREVNNYLATRSCLMNFIARALDDPHARTCGRCANCRRSLHAAPDAAPDSLLGMTARVHAAALAPAPHVA